MEEKTQSTFYIRLLENDLRSTDEFVDSAFSATSAVNEEFED
ncbi:MAG TPA: hypothetical protein VK555_04300 [Terriglobales bacterium]|nr:hypothetical protein [Terriglobales bacterium]